MTHIRHAAVRVVLLLLPLCICAEAFAQNLLSEAYMVPSTVYVGDRANLILPLPGYSGIGDTEVESSQLPASVNIDIHRVAFERRPGGSRLVIEFSAYMPGLLDLPTLEIAGEIFAGLTVEISSILDSGISGTVLSGPALPLAVPGTSLLLYGTISMVVLPVLFVLWVLFWGHKRINTWLTLWKRKRLLVSMMQIEKRLRKALAKGAGRRETLDALSSEFRSFLAWFTGEQCRAMTAIEIGRLGLPDGEFLEAVFSRCDRIRFGGGEINADETLAVFDDVKRFLAEIAA